MHNWPELLLDAGTITSIAGDDESVAAARGAIAGHDVVAMWCRFDVAAGTMSIAAGQRIADAVAEAIEHGVPVVAVANSGGARMQEGTASFVQMLRATASVRKLKAAGLPFIVYLAHPTMGGVFASWASLGHVTFAEPNAMIGFTGPRVAAALGQAIEPAESQRAEALLGAGHVDDIVHPVELATRIGKVLDVLCSSNADVVGAPTAPSVAGDAGPQSDGPRGWDAVTASRQGGRTRVLDVIDEGSSARVELRGDRCGSVDPAVRVSFQRVFGRPLLVVAHQPGGKPGAAGLRLSRRAAQIAEELGIGVLTVIDTPGATIGGTQEHQGFAPEVARSLDAFLTLRVPTVALIAGQGTGGAALAWMATDRVLALFDSWVAPISPEAASLIVHRDADHAAEMANLQRIAATELCEQGIIDEVVQTPEQLVKLALATLDDLGESTAEARIEDRLGRFGILSDAGRSEASQIRQEP